MNSSSLLTIFALLLAAVTGLVTLATEKPEHEIIASKLRRNRKRILCGPTVSALVLGVWQARVSDQENKKAKSDKKVQHDADQSQITQLQQLVRDLSASNEIQYQHQEARVQKLQDKVEQLKLSALTREDKNQIAALQDELSKARAPKPKANLEFGFYYPNLKIGEVRQDKFITSNGQPIKVPFSIVNPSKVMATDFLHKLKEELRAMPDEELVRFGREMKARLSVRRGELPGDLFTVQLEVAREEWRRRHPPINGGFITNY